MLGFRFATAQQNHVSMFSGELKYFLATGIGNNFFKDSFMPSSGIDLGLNYKINQKFAVSLDLRNTFLKIKDPNVYGNFTNINMLSIGFGGKYIYQINEKMNLEGKILIGQFVIKGNVGNYESDYTQDGFSVIFGANGEYFADKKRILGIVYGIELQQIFSKIAIDNQQYKKYYNESLIISPNLGLRVNF